MHRLINVFIFLIFLSSCGFLGKSHTTKVKFDKSKCFVVLPRVPEKTLKVSAHGEEYQFWFPDSSVLYINTSKHISLLNYEKLYDREEEYFKRQFEVDSLTVIGVEENGRHWEDRKLGSFSVGYTNVRLANLIAFQKALNTFHAEFD